MQLALHFVIVVCITVSHWYTYNFLCTPQMIETRLIDMVVAVEFLDFLNIHQRSCFCQGITLTARNFCLKDRGKISIIPQLFQLRLDRNLGVFGAHVLTMMSIKVANLKMGLWLFTWDPHLSNFAFNILSLNLNILINNSPQISTIVQMGISSLL